MMFGTYYELLLNVLDLVLTYWQTFIYYVPHRRGGGKLLLVRRRRRRYRQRQRRRDTFLFARYVMNWWVDCKFAWM